MKAIITLFTLVFFTSISAQSFSGKATYKTSRKSTFKFGKEQKGITDKMQEQLKKRMQKMNQKTFILNFDKKTSTYKEDVKLEAPKPNIGGGSFKVISLGGSGKGSIYYKNIKEKRYADQNQIMGKVFLIKDSLPNYDWKLSSETKNIGHYTCYKATFSKEVESVTLSMVNGKSKEIKKKETVVTTAWYTTQVPISNGPDNFQGLPGLILEINDGKRLIVCTEIILNPSNKIDIVEPEKGKIVSQEEFNKIQKEKSEDMMEKMNSRNGMNINGINIKMGG